MLPATPEPVFGTVHSQGSGRTVAGEAPMYYIVESPKSFDQASADLDAAVKRNGFGVLHVHDLGTTLRSKGQAFTEEPIGFEQVSRWHAMCERLLAD